MGVIDNTGAVVVMYSKTGALRRNTAPVKSFLAFRSKGKRSSFHPLCRFSCSVAARLRQGIFRRKNQVFEQHIPLNRLTKARHADRKTVQAT